MAKPLPILVYEPDAGIALPDPGERYSLHAFRTVGDAFSGLTHLHPQAVVVRLDEAGLDLCRHVVERDPVMPVIFIAPEVTAWMVVEGMRAGARDVVTLEDSWQTTLLERLDRAIDWRQLLERDTEAQVQSFMIQTDLYQQRAQQLGTRVEDLELQLRAEKGLVEQTQQQLERQRSLAMAAVRAKGSFLASVTHELHTPLNAILGYAEMLAEEHGEAVMTECAGIVTSGQRLTKVLQDVLDLARLEAGEVHPVFEPVLLADVVEQVLRRVEPVRQATGATVVVELAGDLAQVVTDPTRLGEALGHLVDNALKFGQGSTVTVRSRRDDGGLVLSVQDGGIGFDPVQLDHMFAAFTQVDDADARQFGGAGMGLAVANQLARVLGGRLSGTGRPGEGAEFAIWLPELEDGTVEEGNSRAITVLVVDDDPVLRKVLQHMLVADGHSVVTTASATDALQLAREHRPALIALDVLLPGTDGLAVLAELKADPELAGIPVVMLSATEDRGQAAELGARDFLTKPVTRDRLRAVIAEHALQPTAHVAVVDGAPSSEAVREGLTRGGIAVERFTGSLRDLPDGVQGLVVPLDLPVDQALAVFAELDAHRHLPVFAVGEADAVERAFLDQFVEKVFSLENGLVAALQDQLTAR